MARWTPKDNQPVGANEHIGRRLFDEPKLVGATDQPSFQGLDLRNFEVRDDREFSVDRVGQSSCDRRVLRYLTPRANDAAKKFREPKTFNGWVVLRATNLTKPHGWPLVASPDFGQSAQGGAAKWADEDLTQNRYHAHVDVPQDMDPLFFAFKVRELFAEGDPHYPEPHSKALRGVGSDPPRVWRQIKLWVTAIRRLFARTMRK